MRRFALGAWVTLLAVVSLGSPSTATTNCQVAQGFALGNVGRVDLVGTGALKNNRGIAADSNVYNAFLRPAYTGENFTLFALYISDGEIPGASNYLEFMWIRRRTVFGYTSPGLRVVKTTPSGQTTYDLDGPLSLTNHRFKMLHMASDDRWHFWVDDVEVRRGGSVFTLDDFGFRWGVAYATGEVTDSCNAEQQYYNNAWRFSQTNGYWIHLGEYNVAFSAPTNLDSNNHMGGWPPFHDDFEIYCNSGHGCNYLS